MQDSPRTILMNAIERLCKLIEDPPSLILANPSTLTPDLRDVTLKVPPLTVLHHHINRDIFLVDLVLQISHDMDVVDFYQNVYLVYYLLLLLGSDVGVSYLPYHH